MSHRFHSVVLLLLAARLWPQGIITTSAGTDWIFPDDGRVAVQGRLAGPAGVAADTQGNVYFAEPFLNMVMKLDARGILTVLAGNGLRRFAGDGGPARAASLAAPRGVAVDAAGNVYVSETLNHRVRKISPSGIITTLAGTGQAGFGGDGGPANRALLAYPEGLAVDAAGNVYILGVFGSGLRKVDASGVISTQAPGDAALATFLASFESSAIPFGLDEFIGIAADPAGNVYVPSEECTCILRVAPNGAFTRASGPLPFRARAVAIDAGGNLYVSLVDHRVGRISPGGIFTPIAGMGQTGFSGDGGPAAGARFHSPLAVAVDGSGNVYISDHRNYRLRRVTAGTISTVAGRGAFSGDGGPAVSARLNSPTHIVVDPSGNLLVADTFSNRVRKVTPGGVISTVAGTNEQGCCNYQDGIPATRATIAEPAGLAVDASGNLYIITVDGSIRKVSPSGVITTVTRGPDRGGSWNAAVDRNGNLYYGFVDGNDEGLLSRVQKVSPDGRLSTAAGSGPLGFSGDGGPATSAALGLVNGLAFDPSGNLYIADASNHRVRKVDTSGIITTFAGNGERGSAGDDGPAKDAQLDSPSGVAVDASGNLYISTGNRVRRVDSRGIISAYAGAGRYGFSGDGGPAASAAFALPGALAVDGAGNLYVVDLFNNRVRLVQAGPSPSILLSQKGLTFSAVAGGGVPPTQSFTVVNGGQGSLNWTAAASTVSGGQGWLSAAPATGASESGKAGSAADARVNPAGLAAGDYYGQVEVRAASAPNSPQSITVVLSVLAAGSRAGVSIQPAGLIFVGAPGGANPAPQALALSLPAGQPVTFRATASFGDGRAWFTIEPSSGTVGPGPSTRVELRPSSSGFAAGVYNATVTFTFSDGSTKLVQSLLVLSAGGGPPALGRPLVAQSGCNPTRLLPLFTSLGAGFSVTAGWPTPLEVRVVDDCGRAMTTGSVAASFSTGDPPVSLASLQDGRWAGTWQGRGSGQVTIALRAETRNPTLSGATDVTGGLQANANPPPEVAPGGVLNAASYALRSPMAPGSLVAIFGTRLADREAVAGALPLPIDLGGTTAVLAGRPLALLFAGANQVNAVLPFEMPINATHQLVVRRGTAISVPEPVSILLSQPGVFTKSATGQGEGIVIKVSPDGSQSIVGPGNGVTAGDAIVIYCAGLGSVEPGALAGSAAPVDPLARIPEGIRVTIGGLEAQVFFAGLTPGFTGLYQVNALVPEGVAPGNSVPLVLSQGDRASPPVTVAVR